MSKQFDIKGVNGLYLSYKPEITLTTLNYKTELIEDYDFFPSSSGQANLYSFKNSRYENPSKITGSNSSCKTNSVLTYSEITVKDELVANKKYYNTFKLYFKFYGSTINSYQLPGINAVLTKKILDRLRVKIYVTIGSNKIPMELSNLQKYVSSNWVSVTGSDVTGAGSISGGNYGIQLSTGLNSEDCIDMAYTGTTQMNTLFNGYQDAPEGYNFRVDASFPDFEQIAQKTKNFKLTIKYYNIGVSGSGTTYSASENVELMSNTFVFYEQAQTPSDIVSA